MASLEFRTEVTKSMHQSKLQSLNRQAKSLTLLAEKSTLPLLMSMVMFTLGDSVWTDS